MINRFLSTFGAVALFAMLVGFGTREPVPARDLAKSISQIPITHHFSQYFASVGSIYGGPAPTLSGTMPVGNGVAISQITGYGYDGIVVRIDGNVVLRTPAFYSNSGGSFGPVMVNPPLIAPPGSVVEIGHSGGTNYATDLTVTGYTLETAYFGGP